MATPATLPEPSRKQQREQAERATRHREAEHVERRRQLRGLLALAFIVLVFSIARAGLDRVFPHGWWRLW